MKKVSNLRRLICLMIIVPGFALLQSCVVYSTYSDQMVTVPDIVKMSKDGRSSKDIIKDIRHSHTIYNMKADQLARLREEGVQDSVINYMEKTHIDAVRRNQQMSDSYYGWPGGYYGYYGGFGMGWPWGYYGYGWGPTIIFSGHRNFGGELHEAPHGGHRR